MKLYIVIPIVKEYVKTDITLKIKEEVYTQK